MKKLKNKSLTKKITKVVEGDKGISHIDFIDTEKEQKGSIYFDSIAGITPLSQPAQFYKVKNKAYTESAVERKTTIESPKLINLDKDNCLYPCSKEESASVVRFIKENLQRNKSIMNEETIVALENIVDNYEFEKILN